MKVFVLFMVSFLLPGLCFAEEFKDFKITPSPGDEFILKETETTSFMVLEEFSNPKETVVMISLKENNNYAMALHFKNDATKPAKLDTLEKIKSSVMVTSVQFVSLSVEKDVHLKDINWKGQAGAYAVFTDEKIAKTGTIPPGEYKYITRGMVPASHNTVLAFQLVSNDIDTPEYKNLFTYAESLVKEQKR